MKTSTMWTIIVVVVILVILGFMAFGSNTTTTTDTTTNTGTVVDTNTGSNPVTTPTPQTVTVEYTESGFSPATITIHAGDTVNFVNKTTTNLRVASDPHPTHTVYPGFDQGTPGGKDSIFAFKFDNTGSWGYHNHASAGKTGTVIVQ